MIFYKLKPTVWAPVCLIVFSSAFVHLENELIDIFMGSPSGNVVLLHIYA